ncbi:MAG: hypothetical protein RIC93_06655 [Alphaproteobacteria bacterium]
MDVTNASFLAQTLGGPRRASAQAAPAQTGPAANSGKMPGATTPAAATSTVSGATHLPMGVAPANSSQGVQPSSDAAPTVPDPSRPLPPGSLIDIRV